MNQRTYPSADQKARLVAQLQVDAELSSGKFSSTFSRKAAEKRWIDIAEDLNSIPGAVKTWVEWRKTWQDIKCSIKKKTASLQTTRAKKTSSISNSQSLDASDLASDDDELSMDSHHIDSTTSHFLVPSTVPIITVRESNILEIHPLTINTSDQDDDTTDHDTPFEKETQISNILTDYTDTSIKTQRLMNTKYNYNYFTKANVCRLCWSDQNSEFIVIDKNITSKILKSIEIDVSTRIPKKICFNCHEKIENYYEFKKSCQEADKRLKNILNNAISKANRVDFCKIEIEDLINETNNELKQSNFEQNISSKQLNKEYNHIPNSKMSEDETSNQLKQSEFEQNLSSKQTNEELNHIPYSKMSEYETSDELKQTEFEQNLSSKQSNKEYNHIPNSKMSEDETSNVLKQSNFELNISTEQTNKEYNHIPNLKMSEDKTSDELKQSNFEQNVLTNEEFNIPISKLSTWSTHSNTEQNIQETNETDSLSKDTNFFNSCERNFDSMDEELEHISLEQKNDTSRHSNDNFTNKNLKHDLDKCNINEYKCEVCSKLLPNLKLLQSHMTVHKSSNSQNSNCKKCAKQFEYPEDLRRHMYSHKKEIQCICETCGRVFKNRKHLEVHKLIHTSQKKLHCPHCEYRATQPISLKYHMRLHTGEKPYACDRCPYRSVNSSNLKKHIKSHEGIKDFKCPACDKAYAEKKSLTDHISSVHEGLKNHVCKQCGTQYSRLENLRKHMLSVHGQVIRKVKNDFVEVPCGTHLRMSKSRMGLEKGKGQDSGSVGT